MRRPVLASVVLLVGLLQAACSHNELFKVVRTDGAVVIGTVIAMRPDAVVIGTSGHETVTIPRALIASIEPFTPERVDATKRDTSSDSGSAIRGGASGDQSGRSGQGGQIGQHDRPDHGSSASGGTSGASGASADSAGAGTTPPTSVPNPDTRTSHDASGGVNRGTNTGGTSAGGTSTVGTASGGTGSSGASAPSGNHASASVGGSDRPGAVLPADSMLALSLDAPIGSDTSRSEQTITATLKSELALQGGRTVPAGTRVRGTLVEAVSARNGKGRGRLAIRFTTLIVNNEPIAISTTTLRFTGSVLRKPDLSKIGAGTAIGGAFGSILGRTRQVLGFATVVGAGAGSALAMVTRTNDVRLERGAVLRVRLDQSVIVPAS